MCRPNIEYAQSKLPANGLEMVPEESYFIYIVIKKVNYILLRNAMEIQLMFDTIGNHGNYHCFHFFSSGVLNGHRVKRGFLTAGKDCTCSHYVNVSVLI